MVARFGLKYFVPSLEATVVHHHTLIALTPHSHRINKPLNRMLNYLK